MKRFLNVFGAMVLTLASAVGGAMLTTNYSAMRSNGASYLPALQGGLVSLWRGSITVVSSPWFFIPLGALALVLVTVRLTIRVNRPKKNPYGALGYRMDQFVDAAHQDQRYRGFSTLYHDTMRLCREIEAFIVEIHSKGIPIPSPQSNSAEDWIDLCCEYFTAVGPYLRNGNFNYALVVAQKFSDRYPRPGQQP